MKACITALLFCLFLTSCSGGEDEKKTGANTGLTITEIDVMPGVFGLGHVYDIPENLGEDRMAELAGSYADAHNLPGALLLFYEPGKKPGNGAYAVGALHEGVLQGWIAEDAAEGRQMEKYAGYPVDLDDLIDGYADNEERMNGLFQGHRISAQAYVSRSGKNAEGAMFLYFDAGSHRPLWQISGLRCFFAEPDPAGLTIESNGEYIEFSGVIKERVGKELILTDCAVIVE